MKKNADGSVTLSKSEFASLNRAYQGLHETLDAMPTTLSDFFDDDHPKSYLNICKWHMLLQGKKYVKSDWYDAPEE